MYVYVASTKLRDQCREEKGTTERLLRVRGQGEPEQSNVYFISVYVRNFP